MFSAHQVILDESAKQSYETDWRGRYSGSALAVVLPNSLEEVSTLVKLCHQYQLSIVPQSGNTSLCGASVPISTIPSIIVNLSRLNRIREIDLENNTITVESGVILENLALLAQQHQRFFPLSMASEGSAQVGGIISTNAGGSAVIRYGNMRSLVMGLEVVLASGDVWTALNGLRKDNSGYDLKQLFIGAEGTLGLITAATLKLMPLPHTREVYWLTTDSLSSAVSTLSFLKNHVGENISAFEIMSSECLHLVGKHFPTLPIPAYQENQWAILVELEFFHHTTAHENIFMHCIDNNLISNVVVALNQQQIMQCWAVREHIPLAEKTEGFSIKHDISLPISAISEFVDRAIAQVRALIPGVITVCFGHLGDGNLHFNFTNPSTMKKETFLSLSSAINDLVYDLVYEYRGSLSAEHGIGQLKIKDLIKYKSPLEMKLMRTIKTALDPLNLMNPGKLLSQQ